MGKHPLNWVHFIGVANLLDHLSHLIVEITWFD